MSRPPLVPPERRSCFPRVSGDEPNYQITWVYDTMFSPRERG